MRLPERFCITIVGQVSRVRARTVVDHQSDLVHVLAWLLSGGEAPPHCWRPYGLQVTIEEDTDQGDEPQLPPTLWIKDHSADIAE